jgi:choline-sulfatase
MSRPRIVSVLPALLALLAPPFGLGACSRTPPPAPDHVLLIVVDTLRADHLSAYGYPRPTSPALDRLAAEGILFRRAVSQSSWTSPSMVSMMTGRYISEERLAVPESVPTLAETFQGQGWATAAFVSNDILSEENGFRRGFDEFVLMQPYDPDDPILEWLRGRAGKKTFTWVHLAEPHDPYMPPEGFLKYRQAPGEPGRELLEYYREVDKELGLEDFESSVARIQEEIGGYDDDVAYCDRRIAALLGALEASGQKDSTAVVIASDHGEGLWTRIAYHSGQRDAKHDAGEAPTLVNTLMPTHGNQVNRELVHVPLILRSPGLPKGRVVDSPVENLDIAPTLIELCRLEAPRGLQGESLLAALERSRKDEAGFSHTRFASTLITADGWQLIAPTQLGRCQEGLEIELYDLNSDPDARRDIAAEHVDRVHELLREIERRLAKGISGDMRQISNENLIKLKGLGYIAEGTVEAPREDLAGLPFKELGLVIADYERSCLERLDAARALRGRTLDEEERSNLGVLLQRERAPAVRAELQRLLDEAAAR